MPSTPKNEALEPASGSAVKDASDTAKRSAPKREPPIPSLATYFGTTPVPVRAFIKAIKAAKIRRFEEDDERASITLMQNNDPEGARLWALVSQSELPEAIDNWVWGAVQSKLKAEVPGEFDPLARDSLTVLKTLHRQLSTSIHGREKIQKRKSENLLRIGLTWLAKRRALDPWEGFSELRVVFFSEGPAAARRAKRILTQGKSLEIKSAAAICGLVQEKVRTALSERDDERRQKNGLQEIVSRLEDDTRIVCRCADLSM